MTKLSIIIPVYNVEKYLKRCLDSIVNQTLEDIEIICIDDGSSDNSLKILEYYSKNDKRFVVINKENEGVAKTRNIGLDIACGEYIAFVDSDDYIPLNFLERLYTNAVENDADMAVSSIKFICGIFSRYFLKIDKNEIFHDIEDKLVVCDVPKRGYVWNKIYRKSFIDNNKLRFKELKIHEDMPFNVEALFYSNKLVTVKDTVYYYISNKNTLMTTKFVDRRDIYDCACEITKDFADSKNFDIKAAMQTHKKYKFFGITVFKKSSTRLHENYFLFGFIKVFSRKKNK